MFKEYEFMIRHNQLKLILLLSLFTIFSTILPIYTSAQFPDLGLSGDEPTEKLSANGYISLDKVQPGNEFKIAVVATIAEGWHVNANPTRDPLIPTEITFPEITNITFGEVVYPAGDTLNLESIGLASVYHDTITFGIPATLQNSTPIEQISLTLKLTYQACNDEQCLFPETLDIQIPIEVVGTNESVKNVNEDIFASIDFGNVDKKQGGIAGALSGGKYWLAFLFVFGAGIATSLTPCVYPLIPITVSIFGANESSGILRSFLLSLVYVFGIIVTYSILGVLVALVFSRTGAVFGQIIVNPYVIIPICVILFSLGLSMFGVFEIRLPTSIQNRLNTVGGTGFVGAFAMGTVAGVIAAPCTGPALAAVLAYIATTGSTVLGFWLMSTYALGMGILFICIGTFSGLISSLPRSGGWMYILENIFGIAIITVALYFLKDVYEPLKSFLQNSLPFFAFAGALVLIGLWLGKLKERFSGLSSKMRVRKSFGLLIAILGAFMIVGGLQEPVAGPHPTWVYDDEPAALETAKQENKLVMLDFYATWCAACNELDHKTFSDQAVVDKLKNYVTVKLDFSVKSDEALTEKYKILGLPVVIFMDANGKIYKRVEGFVNAEDMLKIINEVEAEAKSAIDGTL